MAKKKILIVDDEIDFINMMKIKLEENDYDVVSSSTGKDVIDIIKKQKPDAVLLDVMMPEVDGLNILKQVRSFDETIPVFIVTAFSNEERIKLAGKFNASGVILKFSDNMVNEIKHLTKAIGVAEKYRK
ncbi:MAG TPA: response regulator [Candidatus Omnitrophota bacterium]|nr:response regulator [Candidatus Omnitrophota bacterium]